MSAPYYRNHPPGSATDDQLRQRLDGWTRIMTAHIDEWTRARHDDGWPIDLADPCDRENLAKILVWSYGWRGPRLRSLPRLRTLEP